MILLDLNQMVIANVVQEIDQSKNDSLDENFIRYMIVNSIKSLRNKFGSVYGELVICSDSTNYWRKDVFPHYKANRKKSRDESIFDWSLIYTKLNKIKKEIRDNFPYKFVEIYTAEADDIIAILCEEFAAIDMPSVIISGDKDFIQLQKFSGVSQYSPTVKSWLKESNPTKYLLAKILGGDSGDGVPNFLSDDDTFIVEDKRQKPLSKKRLDDLLSCKHPESMMSDREYQNFLRNKYLIDFTYIPEEIKKKILSAMNKTPATRGDLAAYFRAHGLKALTNAIGDF